LIKLFAAEKRVGIIYWSAGEMDRFISNNIEKRYKKLFRELLDKGQILHFNFYEDNLSEEGFKERFDEVVQLIEEAKKIVCSKSWMSIIFHKIPGSFRLLFSVV